MKKRCTNPSCRKVFRAENAIANHCQNRYTERQITRYKQEQ